MNAKKIVLSGIAGGVVLFLLGWLFYGTLLVNFFKSQTGSAIGVEREIPSIPFVFLGNLFWGFLLALIFNKWATITKPLTGAKAGAMIGLLATAGFDFLLQGLTNLSTLNGALADIVVSTVMFALAGAVVGFVSGKA